MAQPGENGPEWLDPTDASKIAMVGVTKRFHGAAGPMVAIDRLDLAVAESEFLCIVGPSGCGKSTLLNLVAGLERPDDGEVRVDGRAVEGPGRERMMMFQEAALFPWLDVRGNVMFGLRLKPGLDRRFHAEIARFYLKLAGLEAFERSRVHELSVGMRQRVALARCLAPNPKVLLMDEPFGALDAMTREALYADLQRIWMQRRKTILFVTHDLREAICLGDRVVILSQRPARVKEEVRVDLPRPRDPFDVRVAELAADLLDRIRRPQESAERAP